MNKPTLQEKLIKNFYGIAGPLDEFRRKEAMRMGNTAFVCLFVVLGVSILLALALGKRFPELVGYGFPALLEGILFTLMMVIAFQSSRSPIIALDPDELSEQENRALKWASLKFALGFTITMYFFNVFYQAWMEDGDLGGLMLENLTSPRLLLAACLGGVFVGIALQILLIYRKKKAKNPIVSSAISQKEKPWVTKLIKHFYGIRGPLDEYRRMQADEIGGIAFIYLSHLLLTSNAVAFVLAIRYTVEVAIWYPILLGAFLFVAITILSFKMLNRDFGQFDPEEIDPKERKIPPYRPFRWGIGVTLLSLLFSSLSDLFDSNRPFLETIFQAKNLFYACFMGLFASLVLSAINYIKRLENEEYQRKVEKNKK